MATRGVRGPASGAADLHTRRAPRLGRVDEYWYYVGSATGCSTSVAHKLDRSVRVSVQSSPPKGASGLMISAYAHACALSHSCAAFPQPQVRVEDPPPSSAPGVAPRHGAERVEVFQHTWRRRNCVPRAPRTGSRNTSNVSLQQKQSGGSSARSSRERIARNIASIVS